MTTIKTVDGLSLPYLENFSDIAINIFTGNFDFTQRLHPRLSVAIQHLSERYLEHLTQSGLAQLSCISSSHLAFLFRSQLKMRFKELLVQLRLLYTLSRLKEEPLTPTTELYLLAGFGDLSHFEKMFRRYTELSPEQVRNQFIGLNTPDHKPGLPDVEDYIY